MPRTTSAPPRTAPLLPTLLMVMVGTACAEPAVRNGGPEHRDTAAQGSVQQPPVTGDAPRTTTVLVHFTRDEAPFAVEREVTAPAVLRGALEQQLSGPTPRERDALGVTSWFSAETAGMLRSVTLDEEGRAIVDFEDFSQIIPGASSSLGSLTLLGELNATVFQFPQVQSVEYRFAGSCDAFSNWLQYDCQVFERGRARTPR